MSNKERPSIFIGWVHKGKKNFEVIPESKVEALLKKVVFRRWCSSGCGIYFQNDYMSLAKSEIS